MHRRVIHVGLRFLLGSLLAQAAWILAVPPYRGSDEFDHAYRASSVAHGYWMTWEAPQDGRGDLIPTARSVVIEGREICRSYEYPGADNCRAVENLGDGLSNVASAASRYNPIYYWVVGLPSLPFEGAKAVYVMRLASALMNALLISLAAMTTALWARGPWPHFALIVALTPVLMYSTIVVAPNGLEMTAALCLWAALLGLATQRGRRAAPQLILVAGVGSVVVLGVRSLGPLWWTMTITCALFVLSPRLSMLVRERKGSLVAFSIAVACAGFGSIWWILNARTFEIEQGPAAEINEWSRAMQEVPLWVFQSIAAFPLRSQPAPIVVYALAFIPFIILLLAAMKVGQTRCRVALVVVAMASLLVPYAFSVATIATAGTIWQGRYTLPFSVGVVLLAGLILERNHISHSRTAFLLGTSWFLVTTAQVVSVVNVQVREEGSSPLAGDARWIQLPWPVTALLMTVAMCIWFSVFVQSGRHLARERERATGGML